MIKEKFKGTILGSALGDAIGKSVEDITKEEVLKFYGGKVKDFVPPHPSSPAYGQLPEETSDETTIMRILLESVVAKKGINIKDFLGRLIEWYHDETKHRYPDPSLLVTVDLLSRGVDPSVYGVISSSVEGILRSIVIGLLHYYNPYLAAEGSKVVSMLTHRSPEIQDASAVLGSAISYLVLEEFDLKDLSERLRFIDTLKNFISNKKFHRPMETVKELLKNKAPLEEAIISLGNGTYVFEALPLSLYIFLANIENPIEALWEAVNSYGDFGGDTDSIGFLTGAFLGSYFGIDVFPKELIEKLENRKVYEDLAEKLYDITEKLSARR